MSAPRNARKVGQHRLYEWRAPGLPLDTEPERFWSVTTIIKGGLPSPALTAWGMKSVAEFATANYRQLYAMCSASYRFVRDASGAVTAVVDDPDAVVSAIDWLKGAPYRERERKADAGTAIHEQAEAYVLGKPLPPAQPSIRAQVAAFRQFLADFRPKYARVAERDHWLAEASVYNRTERYAGTLDAIADIPGLGRVLIDYKSSKGVYPETALQLAAYRHAEFIGLPDGTEWPMPPVDGCAVLHLPAHDEGWEPTADDPGYAFKPVIADEQVFRAFKYVREVFRFMEETSRGVIGEAITAPPRRAKRRKAA